MWPWEHAVVGYLAYSIGVRLLRRRSPTGPEAVAVVVASVLPDVIDKPLAWEFGAFQSGYGIAHSVFFAVPAVAVGLLIAAAYDRTEIGAAFGTGYLLHLPADVLPHYVRDGRLPVERTLWPVRQSESSYPEGFVGTFRTYFSDWLVTLLSWPPDGHTIAVTAMMIACALLWVADGMPGLREPVTYLRTAARTTGKLG